MPLYIDATPDPKSNCYVLKTSVIIEGRHIRAPYKWNGASIPFFAWWIIGTPFQPDMMAPSLVHDFDCETIEGIKDPETHKTFRKLLIANDVRKWKATAAYKAVVLWAKFK